MPKRKRKKSTKKRGFFGINPYSGKAKPPPVKQMGRRGFGGKK